MTLWAAIDVGSHSVRLLTARCDGCALAAEDFALTMTRLGATEDGLLTQDAIARTAEEVAAFARRARERGVAEENLLVFATAAVRDAPNGGDFAAEAARRCGVRPRVLTGAQEARLALLGVRSAFPEMKRFAVLDIGGGSTEYAVWNGGAGRSARIGAARLRAACAENEDGVIPAFWLKAARAQAARMLTGLAPADPAIPLIGVGSTATLAAALLYALPGDGPEHVNGRTVRRRAIDRMLAGLASLPLDRRRLLPGMPGGRAEVFPYGLIILSEFLRLSGVPEMIACGCGNLHGAILEAASR